MLQVLSLGGDGKGVVAGYVHGAMGAGMGKNAALVALKLGEFLCLITTNSMADFDSPTSDCSPEPTTGDAYSC